MSIKLLPTKKSKPIADLKSAMFLIYGPPGVGKSTLCSGEETALFVPTEPGLNHLEVFNAASVLGKNSFETVGEVMECLQALREDPKHQFSPIVIDTVDKLYEMVLSGLAQKIGCEPGSDAWDKAGGWARSKAGMTSIIMGFARLNAGLWLISHVRENIQKTRTGDKTYITPALPPAACRMVCDLVDVIGYIEVDEEGNRVIKTKPNAHYVAKDRTRGGMPEELPLDYASVTTAYKKAQKEKK